MATARQLLKAGYKSASEVTLKIDPAFQPVPDVIATKDHIETPYPASHLWTNLDNELH